MKLPWIPPDVENAEVQAVAEQFIKANTYNPNPPNKPVPETLKRRKLVKPSHPLKNFPDRPTIRLPF